MEDTLRKIGKLQTNRVQNNIVIVTDERDDFNLNLGGFDVGVASFDESMTVLRVPGMQFGTVFSSIFVNPYFGKGTIWIFSGGIYDLLVRNPLPDCLEFGCPTPLDLLSTRQCISDSSYLIQNAVQLNMNILNNTKNDVVLFSRLLPVRINHYNKFILMNRRCSSIHSVRPINSINCIYYSNFSKTVSQYNNFIELHARTLGSSPWRLEVPIEFGKKIPLVKLLDFDGYYILWSEEIKNENCTGLLCNELSLTSSLTLAERRRAILIRGLDLRIITKEDLIDYFEEFGQIERTVIHSSRNIGFPPELGIVVFTRDFMADIALSIGGQFRIKEVKLQATRVKTSSSCSENLEAEVQNSERKRKPLKGYVATHPVPGTHWNIVWKNDGRFYFYNDITRQSLWQRPPSILYHPEVDKLIETPPPEVAALISVATKSTDFKPIATSSPISTTTNVTLNTFHAGAEITPPPTPNPGCGMPGKTPLNYIDIPLEGPSTPKSENDFFDSYRNIKYSPSAT